MTNILPISDLKNYSEVLSHCENGSVVYLTKNGRGKYVVQTIEDYEKTQATMKLLSVLEDAEESVRRNGGLTIEEVFAGLERHENV